jgi:hypothetical protein
MHRNESPSVFHNPQKFQNLLSLAGSDIETSVEVGRKFVSVLYDPKGAAKSAHDNLNINLQRYTENVLFKSRL